MRTELIPAALVLLLAGGVATGAARTASARKQHHAAVVAPATPGTTGNGPSATAGSEVATTPAATAPDPADLRRRVGNLAGGTYIADILAQQDSTLYRWPDRPGSAVRVFVEPTSTVRDWNSQYPDMARSVFDEWSLAGFPLRFTFIYDSTGADITIRWVESFPADAGQRIGETERIQDPAFLITAAHLSIATHDSTGKPLSPGTVAGIVRHEVGHALGLNHATDESSVMFHESATSTISASDRATLRLLYLVPAGRLKAGRAP